MPDIHAELRPLLFSISYRMLGSVADAEDIVQEAFLRYHRTVTEQTHVESPKAFLAAITTRLSIDHLRSARVRRETYIGTWLPEPLLAGPLFTDAATTDPGERVADIDSLSIAFLLVLERLGPVERAVFLLHDVFGYSYEEVALTVGKSETNCRQLTARARRHVADNKPRFEPSRANRIELGKRFLAAMSGRDVGALVELLAADVVVVGDSGGIPPSWPHAIVGRDKVIRLILALADQILTHGVTIQNAEVNGQPGATFHDPDGHLINVFSLDIADQKVHAVRSIINPAKLRHLGPLADARELTHRRRTQSNPNQHQQNRERPA